MSICSCYISTFSFLFPAVPSLTDCTLGAVKDLSHLCVKVYLGCATMADCEDCIFTVICHIIRILSWKKNEKINIYDVFAVKISQRAIMSCRRDKLTQPNFLAIEGHTYILIIYKVFIQKIEKIQFQSTAFNFCFLLFDLFMLNFPPLPKKATTYCLIYCSISVGGNKREGASVPTLFLLTSI